MTARRAELSQHAQKRALLMQPPPCLELAKAYHHGTTERLTGELSCELQTIEHAQAEQGQVTRQATSWRQLSRRQETATEGCDGLPGGGGGGGEGGGLTAAKGAANR